MLLNGIKDENIRSYSHFVNSWQFNVLVRLIQGKPKALPQAQAYRKAALLIGCERNHVNGWMIAHMGVCATSCTQFSRDCARQFNDLMVGVWIIDSMDGRLTDHRLGGDMLTCILTGFIESGAGGPKEVLAPTGSMQ